MASLPFNDIFLLLPINHRFSPSIPREYLNYTYTMKTPHPRKRRARDDASRTISFPRTGAKNSGGKQGWKSLALFSTREGRGGNTSGAVPERLISKWRHLSVEADTYVLPGFQPASWCARRGWSGCLLVSSTRKDRRLLRERRKKCTFLLFTSRFTWKASGEIFCTE